MSIIVKVMIVFETQEPYSIIRYKNSFFDIGQEIFNIIALRSRIARNDISRNAIGNADT